MNKQTKILLGLGAVAVALYFILNPKKEKGTTSTTNGGDISGKIEDDCYFSFIQIGEQPNNLEGVSTETYRSGKTSNVYVMKITNYGKPNQDGKWYDGNDNLISKI